MDRDVDRTEELGWDGGGAIKHTEDTQNLGMVVHASNPSTWGRNVTSFKTSLSYVVRSCLYVLFSVCVCMMCVLCIMYAYMYVWGYMCGNWKRASAVDSHLLPCLRHQASLPTSFQVFPCLCYPSPYMSSGHRDMHDCIQLLLVFWRSKLRSSCSCSQPFTHWAISPTLSQLASAANWSQYTTTWGREWESSCGHIT